MPSSSIVHALTWRWRTPTATVEKTMSAAGVKTTLERSRQLSASSPASSRASGGARVRARVEEEIMTAVRCVFIGIGTAQSYYTSAPGDSHLRDTWLSCNTSEVVPRSHARLDCRLVIPASPVLRQNRYNIKTDSILSLCLLLTRTKRRHSIDSIECI